MIDLYYWPTSNGRKITIMLHEVALPYTIIPVNFKICEQYAPEYLAINPNSKIPAIVDHDPIGGGAPVTVFESVTILIYLAEKSGKLMPADARRRYEVMKWAVFQAASIGPMFGQMAYFHDYAEPKLPAALERLIEDHGYYPYRAEPGEVEAGFVARGRWATKDRAYA